MTILEKARSQGLDIDPTNPMACPRSYGLSTRAEDNAICDKEDSTCVDCYNREYKDPNAQATPEPVKDDMRHFDTGAVRDTAKGKGRYDLLPFAAIHALAQHCERGAEHYGERNVDKGIPQHSLIDSAIRHLGLYVQGDAEDYHLVAALWNIAWACEQEAKRPHLVDLPERSEKSGRAI